MTGKSVGRVHLLVIITAIGDDELRCTGNITPANPKVRRNLLSFV